MSHREETELAEDIDIAIIGMAGRFPGAADVEAFWRNIRDGVESVSFFTDEDLRARGIPAAVLDDPGYVKAGIVLEDADRFDAGFFGYSPREAEHIDPQHRLFLESAWEALEHAGYGGASRPNPIGVYAGTGTNAYLLLNLLPKEGLAGSHDISSLLGVMNGNDKDSLTTRVAYKLDLRGPCVTVQTACSTSLVAVHLACRGLLNHEADMALAGGAWVNLLDGGYRYQPGAILSPDGRCRAFDAKAAGTAIGSGVGVVVLKRLADALADGDTVHVVIKGSAVNNDGSAKVGYTAPSVEGQAEVILAAQAVAGVAADTIAYVEAHGTGTTLGDPIEMAALTQAFRASTNRRGFCAVGSVKTNVGHLDAAAGVTGLIKTVMALKHRTLPPSLHFERPNPQIDFAASPFYVNTAAADWPAGPTPRRAGVSSFGMGGTNAHVILEEAPTPPPSGPSRPWQLLTLSARSGAALEKAAVRLLDHLRRHPDLPIADAAYTLQTGRQHFAHRAAVFCHTRAEAVSVLESRDPQRFLTAQTMSESPPPVAFLFPGQGAQHVGMARELYLGERVFREEIDRCIALLTPHLGIDLRDILYPREEDETVSSARLEQTALTQPSLFVVEYALARLWMSWGVRPEAMIGHSIGEYVAACLAGVFSLEDALFLVAARGRLLQETAPGTMLAVALPETAIRSYLNAGCDLAAVNGEDLCVLSGPEGTIEAAERDLVGQGVSVRRLHVSHAFHSAMVEPMLPAFADLVGKIDLKPPKIPFVSNLSGRWIAPQEATDPDYWVRHLRGTVRFAEGLAELLSHPGRILLEVGPGETLTSLAKRHPGAGPERLILSSLPHPGKRHLAQDHLPLGLGRLWLAGVAVDWTGFHAGERRRRVPLPTYPFERQRYWVEPKERAAGIDEAGRRPGAAPPSAIRRGLDDWFYAPSWKRAEAAQCDEASHGRAGCRLVLTDAHGLGAALARRLETDGHEVVTVVAGAAFRRDDRQRYTMRPGERSDYDRLLRSLLDERGSIGCIFHLWSLSPDGEAPSLAEAQARGFFSLLYLAQALESAKASGSSGTPLEITIVTNQLEEVTGSERLQPEKATLLGPAKVIPQEYPNISCRVLDMELPEPDGATEERLIDRILVEARIRSPGTVIAYRGPYRWIQAFEPIRRDAPARSLLRKGGVYLITGGLGGIGLTLARHLAQTRKAKLVLLGRSGLPPREGWNELLSAPGQPESVRLRIRHVADLEALGAEVLVLRADVAREGELRAAVAEARRRFGAIHGVIHAAGEAGGGLISLKTAEAVEKVFAPKIQGTRVLQAVFEEDALDFMLFCSAITAIGGGFGQVDYCAANLYLDAVARASSRRSKFPVLSVNWDSWREVGMAAGLALPDGLGISPHEGGEVLDRILGGPVSPQVIVSTVDFEAQLALAETSQLARRLQPAPPAPARARHARPVLRTAYEPPNGELEQGLAEIWQSFLGIDLVGVRDNLFELGGDSLLAIQLLSRVRTAYAVELHPADFFRDPTVAGLAVLVETRLIEEIERP